MEIESNGITVTLKVKELRIIYETMGLLSEKELENNNVSYEDFSKVYNTLREYFGEGE